MQYTGAIELVQLDIGVHATRTECSNQLPKNLVSGMHTKKGWQDVQQDTWPTA